MDEEQREFFQRFTEIKTAIEEIISIDDDLNQKSISEENRKELENFNLSTGIYLPKLQSGEFTVAIIGLEKAGKSSLTNALVGIQDCLPVDTVRCTYTTTQLRAGNTNQGEVNFYSSEEFEKRFKERLDKIGCNISPCDFQNINLQTFEDWGESLGIRKTDEYKALELMIKNRKP